MKYIVTKTYLLLFLLMLVQTICAKPQLLEHNQVNDVLQNEKAVNTITLNIPDCPVFPNNDNAMEEHSEYEEFSEEEMLFTKKTVYFVLKSIRVKKKSNKNTNKPSNESLGIIIPPPKA